MPEMNEGMSTFTEAASESKFTRAVAGAVDKAQRGNSEYWKIRKEIQDQYKWHGGGVWKHHVRNMDAVFNAIGKAKEAGFLSKLSSFLGKTFLSRLVGVVLTGASVPTDIVYNTLTWLPRKFLLIPKDPFKKLALVASDALVGVFGVGTQIAKAEVKVIKGVRMGAEAVVSAPEVAGIALKHRVDAIVDNMKKPRPIEVPAMEGIKLNKKPKGV